jgi:hypothetical protein
MVSICVIIFLDTLMLSTCLLTKTFQIQPTEWEDPFLEKSKSKNYQDGKDKEDDRRNPIAAGRSVCVHGTIPLRKSVTLVTMIAQLLGTVCHPDVTFR